MVPASKIHLVVLVHGLWGNPSHVEVLQQEVLAAHAPSPLLANNDGVEVVVLNTVGNAADRTYDGVDFCAGRVVEEIEAEVEKLEREGGKQVVYFSVAGYSLGGLVARCAIGILHSQTPSFFDTHTPLNFATFASPWLGMPRYATWFSSLSLAVGSRMLGRTGEQLFNADKEVLVARMARKGDVFYQALELFEKVDVYANTVRDRTVPYVTGSFSLTDPFADFETNGIEIETHPSFPLIKSYTFPSAPPISLTPRTPWYRSLLTVVSPSPPSTPTSTSSKPARRPYLPPFLRFAFPLNVLFFLSLPIAIPVLMGLVLWRFNSEGRRSRSRIKGVEGQGVRERLRVLETELEEYVEEGVGLGMGEEVVIGRGEKGKGKGGLMLTEEQKRMCRSLDELPRLRKHLVWFPDAFNSHAVIIARDPKGFPDHALGRDVLRHWATGMMVEA